MDPMRVANDKWMQRHTNNHTVVGAFTIKLVEERLGHRRPFVRRIAADSDYTNVVDLRLVGDRDKLTTTHFDRNRLIIGHHIDAVFDSKLWQKVKKRLSRADCRGEPSRDFYTTVLPYRFDAIANHLTNFIFGQSAD